MDIDALHSALISLTLLPDELRSAQENLATLRGDERIALAQFLTTIERDLRVAKAALASELGFPLCRCCWPPELMATDPDGTVGCSARFQTEESYAVKMVPGDLESEAACNRGWQASDRRRSRPILAGVF